MTGGGGAAAFFLAGGGAAFFLIGGGAAFFLAAGGGAFFLAAGGGAFFFVSGGGAPSDILRSGFGCEYEAGHKVLQKKRNQSFVGLFDYKIYHSCT